MKPPAAQVNAHIKNEPANDQRRPIQFIVNQDNV